MEVRLAECAGFCFGVKRAVDTVYEQLETGKTIYTYGPIVHNEEVVKDLENKGVHVIEDKEEISKQCIKCGKCSEVCPVDLMPVMIIDNKEKAQKLKVDKCIECGLCSYVCPAKIEVREIIKSIKEQK